MKSSKSPGRPRAFDPDEALDKAMRLFWAKGYEGTSLSDLTEALGINRPSLYAAFGNKEELFRKACERYAACASSMSVCSLEGRPVQEAVAAFLYGTAEGAPNEEHPGCMLVTAALATSEESESVRQEMCQARNQVQNAWQERFERAVRAGELPEGSDPATLARYLMTVSNGMSVQARSGATREELRQVATLALRAWPT